MAAEFRSTYNLLLQENDLVNPLGQNPSTARRLINFIPTRAGELYRKEYSPPFSANPPTGYWFSSIRDHIFYLAGVATRQIIVGVSNNLGTFLYQWTGGGVLVQLPNGAYAPPHNPSGGWVGDPLILYSDGLLYISDGSSAGSTAGTGTIYDGINTWPWGMNPPSAAILFGLTVAAGLSDPTFAGAGLNDLTVSGPFTGGPDATFEIEIDATGTPDTFKWRKNGGAYVTGVRITTGDQYLRNGVSIKFAASTGHTLANKWTITASGLYIEEYVEYALTELDRINSRESAPGARLRVTPQGPGYYKIHLTIPASTNNPPGTSSDWTSGYPDKFRIYRSLLDGTTQLYRLSEVQNAVAEQPDAVTDFSPFYGDDDYTLLPIEPPYRNQKPRPSKVGVKFHNRFALRDENRKSRLWVSGFKEILEQGSYSPPLETVPGTRNQFLMESGDEKQMHNVSDFENYVELTNEAFEIRAMLWFRDGVALGTEKDVVIMLGRHPEDPFSISNTATYKFGVFHKRSFLVTTHGLVIFTADRRLVLDPAFGGGGDRTEQVIDIGWPKQLEFDKTDMQYSNRFQMAHYQFGSDRDWLVIAYVTQNAIDGGRGKLLIYDFQVKGWITFDDIRATCIGIVQEDQGFQFLVAGDSVDGGSGEVSEDRRLKVVTGYKSADASAYAAAAARVGLPPAGTETRPANTYRTALMDLESPELWKVWDRIQYYKKIGTPVVAVKYWADPADIDNLGTPDQVLAFKQLTSGGFQGWIKNHAQARRAVFQFEIAAGGTDGALQGLEVKVLPGTADSRL